MIVCVDTSFLIAAYVLDTHSPFVVKMLKIRPGIFLTPFSRSEAANALYRQAFIGKLTLPEVSKAWQTFEADCAAGVWQIVTLPDSVWETCINLARRFGPELGVRTLDSLHVACALELKADQFWTFDERQARLAEAVGLATSA